MKSSRLHIEALETRCLLASDTVELLANQLDIGRRDQEVLVDYGLAGSGDSLVIESSVNGDTGNQYGVVVPLLVELDLNDFFARRQILKAKAVLYSLGFSPTTNGSINAAELMADDPSQLLIPVEQIAGRTLVAGDAERIEFDGVLQTGIASDVRTSTQEVIRVLADADDVSGVFSVRDATVRNVSVDPNGTVTIHRFAATDPQSELQSTAIIRRLNGVIGRTTAPPTSLSVTELAESLAVVDRVVLARNGEQIAEGDVIAVGQTVDLEVRVDPLDRSKPTTVVLDTGEPGQLPQERELQAGETTVSIRHTFNALGEFQINTFARQASQEAGEPDIFSIKVEEAPREQATGQFVSRLGTFAVNHFDISYTGFANKNGSNAEIRVGAIPMRVLPEFAKNDVRMTISVNSIDPVIVGRSLGELNISDDGNLVVNFESLVLRESPVPTARANVDSGLSINLISGDFRDDLVLSQEDLQSIAVRGLAPPSEQFPTPIDLDIVMSDQVLTVGQSLRSQINVVLNNISANAESFDGGTLNLTVDYGDGSAVKSLRINPELLRHGGQTANGLVGILPESHKHDFDTARDLSGSVFDRMFARSYDEVGDFDLTVALSLPNGETVTEVRRVQVRAERAFRVDSLSVKSNMEVFSRNEQREIVVAKSVPRVAGTLRTISNFDQAAPSVEVEIAGRTQEIDISDAFFDLEFGDFNLMDLADDQGQVTARVTIRDKNGIAEEVTSHTFFVDVPELIVETVSDTRVTPGFDTPHIYQISNLPLLIQRSIAPSELIVVDGFFVNLGDLNSSDRSLVQLAFNHHFRNPETGLVDTPTGFQRIIGFPEDFAGQVEYRVFERTAAVSNLAPQSDFVAALGSMIDIQSQTMAELLAPKLSFDASFLPNSVLEGVEVDLLSGVRAFNIGSGSIRILRGKEVIASTTFTNGALLGSLRHTFFQTGNETTTIVVQLLDNDGNVLDSSDSITVDVINELPRLADAVFGSVNPRLSLDMHPLMSEEDRTRTIHFVRGQTPFFPDLSAESIQAIRAADPDAAILLVVHQNDEESLVVSHIDDDSQRVELELATPGSTASFERTFSTDFIAETIRANQNSLPTLQFRLSDESNQQTVANVAVGSAVTPVTFGYSAGADIRRQRKHTVNVNEIFEDVDPIDEIADLSELDDLDLVLQATPTPVANAISVGQPIEGFSLRLNGATRNAANNLQPGETFELMLDLGDGRKLELFRDTTPESDRAFRVRENDFTDVSSVLYLESAGRITLEDRSDPFRPIPLVSYPHVGRFKFVVTTDIDETSEEDAYGEVFIDVIPEMDVEANAAGAISGEIRIGELPDGTSVGPVDVLLRAIGAEGPGSTVELKNVQGPVLRLDQLMAPHFRAPGQELRVTVAQLTRNIGPRGAVVELDTVLVPNPKAEIGEIAVSASPNVEQRAPVTLQVTLDEESLSLANSAVVDSPFEMTIDLGDGRAFFLSRTDDTPVGQLDVADRDGELSPGTRTNYDVATGLITLVDAQSGLALVSYENFGVFQIQIGTACGFGSSRVVVQDVIPTVVNPAAALFDGVLRFNADVVMPVGGRVKVEFGGKSTEIEIPANPGQQNVKAEVSDVGETTGSARVTVSENEEDAPQIVSEVEVESSAKEVIVVTGNGLFESGDAELRLDVTTLVQSQLDKIDQDPNAQAAGQSFDIDLQHQFGGNTRLAISFFTSLEDESPSFTAALGNESGVEDALVVNQGDAQFIVVPMSSFAPGQYVVTISDADRCVTGEFIVEVPFGSTEPFEEIIASFDGASTLVSGSRFDAGNDVSVEVSADNGFGQAIVVPEGDSKFELENVPVEPGNVVQVRVDDGPLVNVLVEEGNRSPCDSHPSFPVRRYGGSVQIQMDGDTVSVTGDSSNNGVSIFSNDQGTLIRGIGTTLVNGSLDAFLLSDRNALPGDLVVHLLEGNNSVCIVDAAIEGSGQIATGAGVDAVVLSNVSIAGGLQIATGEGDDIVELIEVTSEIGIDIAAGDGNDRVAVRGNVPTPLSVDGGPGIDRVDTSRFAAAVDAVLAGENVVLPLKGDINLDAAVTFEDLLILTANFGETVESRVQGDLDGDLRVTFTDFLLMARDFGKRA